MAAPTPTVRQTPAGRKLKNGHRTTITIALDPDISFWEKKVTPPSAMGGDKVDQTTMFNIRWKTKAPSALIDMGDAKATVAYDPDIYNQILPVVNVETTITVTFPDGSTLAFFGYLQSFEPSENSEDNQPEADITIVATNIDSTGVERDPVLTSVAGT